MYNPKLPEVGNNLLVAIGYGDSAGLPVETKNRSTIQETYGEIRGLHNIENKFFGQAQAGSWSDDTELSLAVADALIEAGGFSMDALVDHHIKAMDETPMREFEGKPIPRGWGKSTWESVVRLKLGVSNYGNSGNKKGEGNGVLMKLAPLAVWQALTRPYDADDQIEQLTLMTHANDLSIVTALVHRDVLAGLLRGGLERDEVVASAYETARTYERLYKRAGHKTSDLLGQMASLKTLEVEDILALAPKGGFHSPETLVMAYGAFMRRPDFPEVVYEAVNYGGDTDSVASIAAAMSVLHSGEITEPHDLDKLNDLPRLRSTGRRLVEVALAA